MKDLLRQLSIDLEDLEDLSSRVEFINSFDEVEIEEIEVEFEEIIDLLKGHFEDIIKLAKKQNKK